MSRQEIYEHYMKQITIYFSQIETVDRTTFMNYISTIMRSQYAEMFDIFKERNMLKEDEIEFEELYKTERFYVIREGDYYTPLFLISYPHLWEIFTNCIYDMKENQEKYRELINRIMCKDKDGEELYKVCDKYTHCDNGPCDHCYQLDSYSDDGSSKINFIKQFLDEEILENKCFSTKTEDFGKGKSLFNLVLDDDSYLSGKVVLSSIKFNIDDELNSLQLIHTTPYYNQYLFIMIADLWNQIEEYKNTLYRTETLKKLCYKIGWLFANSSPFYRGAASFAKIIMNSCLIKCGFTPLKETQYYHAQSDWIALLSPNFDSYYSKIIAWQVFEEWIFQELQQWKEYSSQVTSYGTKTYKDDDEKFVR